MFHVCYWGHWVTQVTQVTEVDTFDISTDVDAGG